MKIQFAIILFGFTGTGSQIVLIRELLTLFYGNEFSIGLILGTWLFGGTIGSFLLGGFADKVKDKLYTFSICQLLLSILLPLSILLTRSIKPIFNILPSSILPISLMAISSLIILVPITFILGFMFCLGCRGYKAHLPASSIGMVYALEGMGAAIGGILTSFFLIKMFNPFEIMGIFSLLNTMMAFFLKVNFKSAILFLIFTGMFVSSSFKGINEHSIKRQFKGYNVISSQSSIYGNITLVEREAQYSFFYNGLYLYTIPDKLSSESAVHFNLLTHPNPLNILLIGGNLGLIEEIIKHPVKNVDYVELDPLIIKTSIDNLSKKHSIALKDKRINIKNQDGRFFIKNTDKTYDSVIVCVGSPCTAQLNRYYTIDFFREVKRVLNPCGIFSFSLPSSENYINPELSNFLNSIYYSLCEVFPDVKTIPGDTLYFLACSKKGILSYDYKQMEERIKQRRMNIKFVREYYLYDKLSKERIKKIEDALRKKDTKVNYDERPISYYYNLIFWTGKFNNSLFKKIMEWVDEKRLFLISLCFFIFIFLFGLSSYKNAILVAIMTTGFSEIAFSILVLLSFQIIYGYMFYKLGLIITSFMIGLSFGSFWIIKNMPKRDNLGFIFSQIGISLYPLLPALFFFFLKEGFTFGFALLFPFLPIIAGFIGGIRFTLANKIYLKEREDTGRVAGLNYGMVLLGSCLGAFFIPMFFIPIVGIYKTCAFVSIMNLVVLISLVYHKL